MYVPNRGSPDQVGSIFFGKFGWLLIKKFFAGERSLFRLIAPPAS